MHASLTLAPTALLGIPYIFQYFRYTPLWLADTVFRKRTDAYRAEVDNYRRIVEQIVLGMQIIHYAPPRALRSYHHSPQSAS